MLALSCCVFIIGGSLIWVIGGYIMSRFFLFFYHCCIYVVIFAKSPYFPGHEYDEVRRHAVTQIAINEGAFEYPDALMVVKSARLQQERGSEIHRDVRETRSFGFSSFFFL